MNILMLSSTFPYPPSRGGTELRTFNLLKYLNRHHHVTLVTQRHADVQDAEVEELRQWVSDLVIFPLPAAPQPQRGLIALSGKVGRFLTSMVKVTPPNVLYRYSPAMQAWVDNYLQTGHCDVITCEHSVNEIYIKPQFRNSVRTVVNIHSSVSGWVRSHLEMAASPYAVRDRLYLNLLLERYEKRYCSKFTQIVVTTKEDKSQVQKFSAGTPIEVIPNGVDLELYPYRSQDPSNHRLVFVGAMDASHNIDAAQFFVLEVLPVLQQRYPEATFSIVGTRPAPEVLALASRPGVTVTGNVPSIAEQLHQASICVIPLRTGYGIKNKTLEAMAAGVPVVSGDRGLEGLDVDISKPVKALRANRVEEYIAAISRLFEDGRLREQLSRNARALIETEYTWEAVGQRYEKVLSVVKC
ncbi:glycosyltransferase family 4 protein [Microcoleus sp. FACHB-672]|uniref:glycosyltransferase family 4 protein n=1 Tax=Microcoleus sp. FACHB-672 TaxID=2692825 RepID=UPI00168433C2|nr:glycosyltransferase family 4 protein [Microcoleus sp. FACHB-672]MBD2039831.1 glycosyltransferase [Microcoleus sp. FACHB-672]